MTRINGKPNVILFGTNQYSVKNNLTFGLVVCTVGYALLLLAGATWFHWSGLTPTFRARPGYGAARVQRRLRGFS